MKNKQISKMLIIILAFVMAVTFLPMAVFADDQEGESGRFAFVIEKLTLGQGYHTEPIWVQFNAGESVGEAIVRFLGEENVSASGSDSTLYVSSIKDAGTQQGKPVPPNYILTALASEKVSFDADKRKKDGWLAEMDFTEQAGWLYIVNNKLPSISMGAYALKDGDVVRITYTLYGYGADLVVPDPEWGTDPIKTDFANYDAAIKVLADFAGNENHQELLKKPRVKANYDALMAAAANLETSQKQLDETIFNFQDSIAPVDKGELNNLIEDVKKLDNSSKKYSNLSWNALQDALTKAAAVNKNEESTASEVANALTALRTAFDGLEVLPTNIVDIKNGKIKAIIAAKVGKEPTSSITDGDLWEIIGALDLSNTDATDDDVLLIVPHMKNITSINLSNNAKLTSAVVKAQVYNWNKLTELNFSSCTGIEEIGENAFYYKNQNDLNYNHLAKITLPNSLRAVQSQAFYKCVDLKHVVFEDGSNDITFGASVFRESGLEGIIIPGSVSSLGERMFQKCVKLSRVQLANRTTSLHIQNYAFQNCTVLEYLDLKDYEITLGNSVFQGAGLKDIALKNIVAMGTASFSGCGSLNISDPVFNAKIKVIPDSTFEKVTGLKKIDIPDSVTEIGAKAFLSCTGLEKVTLPDSVNKIGNSAFQSTAIKKINLKAVKELGNSVFAGCGNLDAAKVALYPELTMIPAGLFSSTATKSFKIPDNITSIGSSAFASCAELKSVTFPNTITAIEASAFKNTPKLKAVSLPGSIKSIGSNAFEKSGLVFAEMRKGTESIGAYAFYECSELEVIIVPDSVTKIGYDAFSGTKISEIDISGATDLATEIFANCKYIKTTEDVQFSPALTELPNHTFYGCTGLEEIKLPDHIKTAGVSTFVKTAVTKADFSHFDPESFYVTLGETKIKSTNDVIFPAGLKALPDYMFTNCLELTAVDLPDSITAYGDCCFKGSNIRKIVIPDTVTSIGKEAFRQCSSLLYAKMPKHLDTIPDALFNECSNLSTVILPETSNTEVLPGGIFYKAPVVITELPGYIKQIGGEAFSNSTSISYLDLSKITAIGDSAFSSSSLKYAVLGDEVKDLSRYAFSTPSLLYLSVPANVTTTNENQLRGTSRLQLIDLRRSTLTDDDIAKWNEIPQSAYIMRKAVHDSQMEGSISLLAGESKAISHKIPENVAVTWKSLDEGVAVVDGKGIVTAKASGVTFVYATTNDNSYNGVVKVESVQTDNADLASLAFSGVELSSSFDPKTYEYAANATSDEVYVYAMPKSPNAIVKINDQDVAIGDFIKLEKPELITITVKVGSNTNTYKLGINKPSAAQTPKLYEFLPAPGQFTNASNYGGINAKKYEDFNLLVSYGGFGGYMTLYFEEPIKNDPKHLYGVDFITGGNPVNYGGFEEPGGVMVAQDKDKDGKPDKWYVLAGSEHYEDTTVWNYKKTYYSDGKWEDNLGNEGTMESSAKYPLQEFYPLVKIEDSTTYDGTIILRTQEEYNARIPMNDAFGYFDVNPKSTGSFYNPYSPDKTGDPMDISWAVDENGLPVYLEEVSFVKLYSANSVYFPAINEKSPEGGFRGFSSTQPLVDASPAADNITLKYEGGSLTIPTDDFTQIGGSNGIYTYNVPSLNAESVKVNVATKSDTIYINNKIVGNGADSKDISLEPVFNNKKVIRVIVQSGIHGPRIYYLNFADAPRDDSYKNALAKTESYLASTIKSPAIGSTAGEWLMLGLARNGYESPDYFANYYRNVENYVKAEKGILSTNKYTEYSRVILALTAIGKDANEIGGYSLVNPLSDYDTTVEQGINGAIFALIALDSKDYNFTNSADIKAIKDKYLKFIIDEVKDDGGWSLSGKQSDVDLTAMALQALAPYKNDYKDIINGALEFLSGKQNENGGYAYSESTSQAIVALAALDIDIHSDKRFVKNNKTLVSSLLDTFYVEGGGFKHDASETKANQMASEQAFYALAAYDRFVNGQNTLYDMKDVVKDLTGGGTPIVVDKSELAQKIEEAESLKDSDYTESTWENLRQSLDRAKALIDDDGATQGQVDDALAGLDNAISQLEEKEIPITDVKNMTDINSNAWYYNDVAYVLAKGIMKGESPTNFGPENNITRGQFVTILGRYAGIEDSNAVNPTGTKFGDVNAASYYAAHVAWASESGITLGTSDTTFEPEMKISRQDMVTMIARFAEKMEISLPEGSATAVFADDDSIAGYAKTAVYRMVEAGIINGVGDNTFDPTATATRSQTAKIIHLLMEYK